ncbi:uridine kinase family protein [Anaerotignum sp.]
MMDFEKYLLEQIGMHPAVQPQDVVKCCYQAAFGAEHLLQDTAKAEAYLKKEYEETAAEEMPLYEPISGEVCRVNLAAWKYHNLPLQWLFRIFVLSAKEKQAGEARFLEYLQTAENVLQKASMAFSMAEWQAYLQNYLAAGISAVHHSPCYREAEHPAYRIVNRKWMHLLPVLQKTTEVLSEKKRCVIAIDGRAASGKTTMTKALQEILEADIIQMDDFFLPPALRTEERFLEPGGNVHYERFAAEVLPHLSETAPFSYRIFDCSRMDYNGVKEIGTVPVRIVEGSYSCHPTFGRYADVTVFSDVEPEEQLVRIRKRNGEQMAEMFRKKWIPLEEAYFRAYQIAEKADIRLK